MNKVHFIDWGLIDYKEAWDKQEVLFKQKVDQKFSNRDLPEEEKSIIEHHLIFCEHPHVYTLGKSGSEENLLIDEQGLTTKQATFYKINRGGDITYHGPGQIVGYPIFDLGYFFTDIHKYLRFLEEAVILTLRDYKIIAGRINGLTGVWINDGNARPRKICAFGVRCSRWVTMHGFAFNVNSDLSYFGNIIPCGITDKDVTSMEKELGRKIDIDEVKEKLKSYLCSLFEMELISV